MKYYAGYKGNNDSVLFKSDAEPTELRHPLNVKFVFGGYKTLKEATRVAMYQGYLILNPRTPPTPIWNGVHESDIGDFDYWTEP